MALLMKKVWRIHQQPHLLISRVFRSANPQHSWIRSSKHNMSLGRRGLLQANQILKMFCIWKVGDGTSIRAVSQPWVHGQIPKFRDNVNLGTATTTRVADLILPNNQGWNTRMIHRFFIPHDARMIQSMELPYRPTEKDRFYWPLTRSGNYSTKSGYGLLLRHQQNETYNMTTPIGSKFFRQLWGLNIMPKWKLFVWKLWHNCLATSSNLLKRGITTNSHCATCLYDNEDDQHIFRSCPLAIEAWVGADLKINSSAPADISMAAWLEFWMAKFLKEDGLGCNTPYFWN